MAKKIGHKTIILENKPSIIGYGSIVGKKEHEGPLSDEFDDFIEDSYFGEDSYEKAESKLQKTAVQIALKKALDLIRNVPDSDTVEIVRCKECKNFENTICSWCRYFEKPITLDDYCSYGEREVNIEQV